jgi:hypothetical protein
MRSEPDPSRVAAEPRVERSSSRLARVGLGILAILVCGLAIKFTVLESVGLYWEDSYWFCLLARSLEGGTYEVGGLPHARFFPGYPLALAALDLLSGRAFELPLLAAWVSAVSGSLAVALCLPLYRRWGLGELGSAVAILGLLLCAPLHLFSALPLYESFFMLFVVVALLLDAGGRRLAAALAAGVATLIKPEGAFLILGVAAAAGSWRMAGLCMLLGAVPVLPWLARNWMVLGSPLATEYRAIYQGFEASGHATSGLAYLRHYPTFMGPLVTATALASIGRLLRLRPALVFFAGSLLLHMAWPGDLERYVLPHAAVVYFLFGNSVERLGSRRPRPVLAGTVVVLVGFFLLQYPDRILAEATRSNSYGAAALRLSRESGDFTALGADHAALEMLSGHFAFSAWHDLDRPAYLMVADLVRQRRLRYQLVTNYLNIDSRFKELREGGAREVILPGAWRLRYRHMFSSLCRHLSAQPRLLGLRLEIEGTVHQTFLYEVSLRPP